MTDMTLSYDRTRHMCYSRSVKVHIQTHLSQRYGPEEAQRLWHAVQRQYEQFLVDQPFIGGRKNRQAGSVYNCIALFACYEVQPRKPSLEEFQDLVSACFVAQGTPPVMNLNWAWARRIAHHVFAHLSRVSQRHAQDWPGNYHMETPPYDPALGPRYRFTTCPIADFARRHGYEALMPAMCNPDYPTLGMLRGGLIRTTTCANGPSCDYWIVGDQNPILKQHPLQQSDDGFWYNEGPGWEEAQPPASSTKIP